MRALPPFVIAALGLAAAAALAQGRGEPGSVPRYGSLRSDEVNLRTGPGVRYPVEWVLKRRNLPVEVLAEFENWRKIRDPQGTEGWVHQTMLSGRRYVVVAGETRALRAAPEPEAPAVARVEPGVVGPVFECRDQWCRIEAGGFRGWLRRTEIWGVYPAETVK